MDEKTLENGVYALQANVGNFYDPEQDCEKYPQIIRISMNRKEALKLLHSLANQLQWEDEDEIILRVSGELSKYKG